MRLALWIGHSGTSAVIAEQFGTAMMPLCSRMRPALISGITSGTFGSMRKAEELSITTAPALTAAGENFRDVPPPAENSAMSTPSNDFSVSSSMTIRLAAEFDGLAGRAGAGQRLELADGKTAPVHGGDEFGADCAGHAGDGNNGFVAHGSVLWLGDSGNKKSPGPFQAGLRFR